MPSKSFRKIVPFLKWCGKNFLRRKATHDNTIRRMRFSCWITKATDTQSEYVKRIAFPLQHYLPKRSSIIG